jgi:hypothetical protein
METIDGRSEQIPPRKALATVLVFFRPEHAHSIETLRHLAGCTEGIESSSVHFAAVVSSASPPEQVREAVVDAGIRNPVLVDRDDELYARLGVQVHPAVVVLDDEQRLVAQEPWRRVNFCDRVLGKIRYALHEIDLAEVKRMEDPNAPTEAAPRTASVPLVSALPILIRIGELEGAVTR